MDSPEQRVNNSSLQPDTRTERTTSPIFQVRFGCGAHSLRLSDWHEVMIQDLDSFFQHSNLTQRNIFFMEDAFGSQSFQDVIRRAYRTYGKYTTAWAYASLHLRPSDGFPPAARIDSEYGRTVASQVTVLADGLRFADKILGALDQIVERKGIVINFALETRKESERTQIKNTVRYMETHRRLSSPEDLRQYVLRAWNMRKVRDQKIVDDLTDLYKKAFKQKQLTKVYVSLGEEHAGVSDLTTSRLRQRPSYEVTLNSRPLYPQYEASAANVVIERALSLMDTKTPISTQQWQGMYAEFIGTSR